MHLLGTRGILSNSDGCILRYVHFSDEMHLLSRTTSDIQLAAGAPVLLFRIEYPQPYEKHYAKAKLVPAIHL